MTADNPRVDTPASLLGILAARDLQCGQARQALAEMMIRAEAAQRALDADSCVALETAVTILKNATAQGNTAGEGFARDLLQHLLTGEKASTFLDQKKYEHWQGINIEGLLEEDDVENLS